VEGRGSWGERGIGGVVGWLAGCGGFWPLLQRTEAGRSGRGGKAGEIHGLGHSLVVWWLARVLEEGSLSVFFSCGRRGWRLVETA
jgi:hypothetical protein